MVKLKKIFIYSSTFIAARGSRSIQSLGNARGTHLCILFVIKWRNLTWMSPRQRCTAAFAHRFHNIVTFKHPKTKTTNNTSELKKHSGNKEQKAKWFAQGDTCPLQSKWGLKAQDNPVVQELSFPFQLPHLTQARNAHLKRKHQTPKIVWPSDLTNNEILLCGSTDMNFVIMYHRAALNNLK